MAPRIIKLFLRLSLSLSFLSAVADRLGWWGSSVAVAWGNWGNFIDYTRTINPWLPEALIPAAGTIATGAEVLFAICLLVGFKTELAARWTGVLLLVFALAIIFSTGIKGSFDYSVFSASAGAFALSLMKEKYLEVDSLMRS